MRLRVGSRSNSSHRRRFNSVCDSCEGNVIFRLAMPLIYDFFGKNVNGAIFDIPEGPPVDVRPSFVGWLRKNMKYENYSHPGSHLETDPSRAVARPVRVRFKRVCDVRRSLRAIVASISWAPRGRRAALCGAGI